MECVIVPLQVTGVIFAKHSRVKKLWGFLSDQCWHLIRILFQLARLKRLHWFHKNHIWERTWDFSFILTSVFTVQHLLMISRMRHSCSLCDLLVDGNPHNFSASCKTHLPFPLYYCQNSNLRLQATKSHCPPPRSLFSEVISQTFLACVTRINAQEDSNVGFLILVPYLIFYRLFYDLVLFWLARDLILKMCFQFNNNFVKFFSLCVIWFILNIL